jgi:hypothetical protein
MVSAVKSRPSHYETLGLQPTAGSAEIARAFTREMSSFRPRAIGGLADVTIAYETLRDPIRRRAYDTSMGLNPVPPPSAATAPATEEPELPPFIAARLRDLASPTPAQPALAPAPSPERAPIPEPQAAPVAEPWPVGERLPAGDLYESLDDSEGGSTTWKRPAMIAGALVLAVGLVGAWAGWTGGNEIEPDQPKSVATVSLEPSIAIPVTAVTPDSPAPPVAETAIPRRAQRPVVAAVPAERVRPARQAATAEPQQFDVTIPDAAPEPAVAQAAEPAPAAAAASMPLSNRVIARTIERIGYACGQIASTTYGGAPGVFTVTCTSGHSYRASLVRGRYHFRRLGRG